MLPKTSVFPESFFNNDIINNLYFMTVMSYKRCSGRTDTQMVQQILKRETLQAATDLNRLIDQMHH